MLVERTPIGAHPVAGAVDHGLWTLRAGRLRLRRNDCFRANRFDVPDGEPVVHHCPGIGVAAGPPGLA